MAKVDVFQAVSESFELIKKNYKGAAVPLMVLIILSSYDVVSQDIFEIGINSVVLYADLLSAGGSSSLEDASANKLDNAGFVLPLLAFIAIFIAVRIAIGIVAQATSFYTYEYFYSLLTSKAIVGKWQERFKGHIIRAVVISVFWIALVVLILIVPALTFLNASANWQSVKEASGILTVVLLLVSTLLLVVAAFFLQPLFIYYALDRLSLDESIRKSFFLVARNLVAFLILWFILSFFGIILVLALLVLSCLLPLLVPLGVVFLNLLGAVTMMKIKLAEEKSALI
ncbi:MAG: hypothetical protein N3E51_04120 [Candidatus Micrarchaeota archaeon]|nr:hypothetical protein [Candidatus Micrarchaeota archaeon]